MSEIGWEDGVLRVRFHNGGIYEYANVDEDLYNKLVTAASVGKAFAEHIKANKDKYPFTKIA